MFDLSGKFALLTGATGGLGIDIARALHDAGADVAITGTRKEALIELAANLGKGVHPFQCNLSSKEETLSLVKQADAVMGRIDILVNNAGVTRDQLAVRQGDEDWDKVIDTTLTAAFRLSRAVLRGMIRRRWGRLINVSSIVGVTGNPGQANYAASKAGLIGMSKTIAQEVAARGITVNCIAPGFIATPMTDALEDTQRVSLLNQIPCGRLGHASDVSAGVIYLASEDAAYITGHTLHINGGMVMP